MISFCSAGFHSLRISQSSFSKIIYTHNGSSKREVKTNYQSHKTINNSRMEIRICDKNKQSINEKEHFIEKMKSERSFFTDLLKAFGFIKPNIDPIKQKKLLLLDSLLLLIIVNNLNVF